MALVAGWLSLILGATTAGATPPAPPPAPTCQAAPHRQFDFWLGEWDVYGGEGGQQLLGRNRIERSGNDCWLSEHWTSAAGNDGTSLNAWDAQYGVWRQFWVGADGVVLRLEGGLRDGAMVLEGELPGAQGAVQRQRISWSPQADGSVLQHWQVSDDGGGHWNTSFLGTYRRRGTAAR